MSRRERLLNQLLIAPRSPEIDERKRRFDELNEFVRARGGWLTSVPGAHEVTIECLPDSDLPDDLRALAYDVIAAGDGERVLPHQIVRFVRRVDSELEPLTEWSTPPIAQTVTHAGIVRVTKYTIVHG